MNSTPFRSVSESPLAGRYHARTAVRGFRRMTPSRIATLLGYGYKGTTPLDVYNEVVHGYRTPMTEAMRAGVILEPVILSEYAETTGRDLYRFDIASNYSDERVVIVHPVHDFIGGIPDAVAYEPGSTLGIVVDAKNVNERVAENEFDAESISPRYYLQIQLYAEMLGLQRSQLAYLVGGNSFRRSPEFDLDVELVRKAIATAHDFWFSHVVPLVPPKPTTRADVVSLYPRSVENAVEASPELVDLVAEARVLKARIKADEKRLEPIEEAIVLAIDESDTLIDPNSGEVLATFKSSKDSTTTDWKSIVQNILADPLLANVRAMIENLVASFTTTKPGSRRLLVKMPKGGE